jgi:methyltransferase-like protein
VKSARTVLSERRPGDVALDDLAVEARARLGEAPEDDDVGYLGTSMLEIYAQGLIELCCRDRGIAYAVAERPVTTPLARHQAATGREAATTLRHQSLTLDHLDRVLLPMLDGTHDRDALVATVVAAVENEELRMSVDDVPVQGPEMIATIVDRKLAGYLRRALLVDTPAPAPEAEPAPAQGTENGPEASS